MKFGGRARRDEIHIDLTPMIDVVFQLVLFLLLSTTFKKEEAEQNAGEKAPGIQVDLPKSSSQAVLSDPDDVTVWIASDGGTYLDDQRRSNAELRSAFRAAAAKNSGTLVIIKADQGVAHGSVVAVMDLARAAGLTRLAIATATEPGAP